jgi:protein-tyrosine-phosphatase
MTNTVKMYCKSALILVLAFYMTASGLTAKNKPRTPKKNVIVFVCEHGVAKSVIAAAHFNRLAHERKLPYIAVARGTEPQDSLMASVVVGLKSDNLAAPQKPAPKLTQVDCDTAKRTVFFCPIPAQYSTSASMQRWQNVPPVSEKYSTARDSIVANVQRLLDELTVKPSAKSYTQKEKP